MKAELKENDLIIWDSGFGYELGYYVDNKGVIYDTELIYLTTGKYTKGLISVPSYEIHPYNDENKSIFEKKYGYTKD